MAAKKETSTSELSQVLDRLKTIDGKLEQLTQAMIQLARTEEKMGQVIKDQIETASEMNKLKIRLYTVEAKVSKSELIKVIVGRILMWLVIGIGIMYASHPDAAIEIAKLILGH